MNPTHQHRSHLSPEDFAPSSSHGQERKGTRSRVPQTAPFTAVILSDGAQRRVEGSLYFAAALACIILYTAACNKAPSSPPNPSNMTTIATPKAATADLMSQATAAPFSVAEARKQADTIGSNSIRVKGHFWWGKEGSMIYDSYYKAILKLQYSDAFNAKHPGLEFFLPVPRRKSNLATVTGRLRLETDGRLVLVADDIQFSENPR
jgi:hypothetical protein